MANNFHPFYQLIIQKNLCIFRKMHYSLFKKSYLKILKDEIHPFLNSRMIRLCVKVFHKSSTFHIVYVVRAILLKEVKEGINKSVILNS